MERDESRAALKAKKETVDRMKSGVSTALEKIAGEQRRLDESEAEAGGSRGRPAAIKTVEDALNAGTLQMDDDSDEY